MIWLEMSRDPIHGGGTWGFGKCIWSPSHKRNENSKWAYWESVLSVKERDLIIHLQGKGNDAKFIGFSIAAEDGYETLQRPPNPGQWEYAKMFYRLGLRDFSKFAPPVFLKQVFKEKEELLRKYYHTNHNKPKKEKSKLFYVVQSNKLQCLNGAYLSEFDNELLQIIFDINYSYTNLIEYTNFPDTIENGERHQILKTRIGQNQFSQAVRSNYNFQCCFPGCNISHDKFLVGSHIARWADVPDLRGQVSNGLCLCLMHDKAFELGYFIIDKNYRISINWAKENNFDQWFKTSVVPFNGQKIKFGRILPSVDALNKHWERIQFEPNT